MEFLKENAIVTSDRMNLKNMPFSTPAKKNLTALADVKNTIHGRNVGEKQFLSTIDNNRDLRSPSPCQKKQLKAETITALREETLPDFYFTSDCCYDAQDEQFCYFLFPDEYRLTKEDMNYFATNFVGKRCFDDDLIVPSPSTVNFDVSSDVELEMNDSYLRELDFSIDIDLSSDEEL